MPGLRRTSPAPLLLLLLLTGATLPLTAADLDFAWSLGHADLSPADGGWGAVQGCGDLTWTAPDTGLEFGLTLWSATQELDETSGDDETYTTFILMPLAGTVAWPWAPVPWFSLGPRIALGPALRADPWGGTQFGLRGRLVAEARLKADLPANYRVWVSVWGGLDQGGRPVWGLSTEWSVLAVAGVGAWALTDLTGL